MEITSYGWAQRQTNENATNSFLYCVNARKVTLGAIKLYNG